MACTLCSRLILQDIITPLIKQLMFWPLCIHEDELFCLMGKLGFEEDVEWF